MFSIFAKVLVAVMKAVVPSFNTHKPHTQGHPILHTKNRIELDRMTVLEHFYHLSKQNNLACSQFIAQLDDDALQKRKETETL